MATNLAIDDALINTAVKVGHHPSKKAAVTAALQEYIQRHKQMEILDLFGKISYDSKYDYKKQRNKE
jgi:Arc/MetJ family transcription regulator